MSGYPTAIGDYEIRGVLGSGASGTVFLAYQEFMDRRVALKELSSELTGDPVFRERFRAEAEVMARLEDDHCVRVFDYFQRENHDYLVTELVEGASLRKILENAGQLTPEQSLGVVKGALLGLARAHDLGLLHRDIKPENILVDTEGNSKLADFGQAAQQTGPGAAGGMPAGSPAYMSPEMVGGGPLDATSDLYSVGAVMFELLTGRPPYNAENPLAVMRMQREAPVPDPHELNPALGPGMTALVQQSLAKDPENRWLSADQFLATLQTVAAEAYGIDWESRSSVKRRVAAAVGAGMGLLALVGTAGAAAASGAVGAAVTAESVYAAAAITTSGGTAVAGGGVLGVNWAVAGAVLGAVLVGGGGLAYAATHGFFKGHSNAQVVAIASPSPSASALLSPTPDVSPSPSPDASPSPSPTPASSPSPSPSPSPSRSAIARSAPTPTPTRSTAPPPPIAGPVTVTNAAMGFAMCPPMSNGQNCPKTYSDASPYYSPGKGLNPGCQQYSILLVEKYNYKYGGAAGAPVTIQVNWYVHYTDANAQPLVDAKSPTSQTVTSGQQGLHDYTPSSGIVVDPQQHGGGRADYARYLLSWQNPDGSNASAPSPGTIYFTSPVC